MEGRDVVGEGKGWGAEGRGCRGVEGVEGRDVVGEGKGGEPRGGDVEG